MSMSRALANARAVALAESLTMALEHAHNIAEELAQVQADERLKARLWHSGIGKSWKKLRQRVHKSYTNAKNKIKNSTFGKYAGKKSFLLGKKFRAAWKKSFWGKKKLTIHEKLERMKKDLKLAESRIHSGKAISKKDYKETEKLIKKLRKSIKNVEEGIKEREKAKNDKRSSLQKLKDSTKSLMDKTGAGINKATKKINKALGIGTFTAKVLEWKYGLFKKKKKMM